MRTYKYKIQSHKRNRHLQSDTRIIGFQVSNHFIALSRRHYRIYGQCEGYKRPTYDRMSKHLTKLKKLPKYAHWRIPYAWALQECLKRIELGYLNFFKGRAKRPPKFKSWRKYRSMTFNGNPQVKIEKVDKDTGCPVAKIRLAGRNQRRMRVWHSSGIVSGILVRFKVISNTSPSNVMLSVIGISPSQRTTQDLLPNPRRVMLQGSTMETTRLF